MTRIADLRVEVELYGPEGDPRRDRREQGGKATAKAKAKASQQPIRRRRRTTPPRRSMLTCKATKKEPTPQKSPFQTTTRMKMRKKDESVCKKELADTELEETDHQEKE